MSNVIRPNFGKPSASPVTDVSEPYRPLRVLGEAAGHVVAVIRDDGSPEGPEFRVVMGPASSNALETVAIVPTEAGSEAQAEAIGFAVLRSLEIVEGDAAPESA